MRSSTWCCAGSSAGRHGWTSTVYPYLPRAQVATTSARAYLALLARSGS